MGRKPGQFADLRWGMLGKKDGGSIFDGEVDTPMRTMQVLLHLGKNYRIYEKSVNRQLFNSPALPVTT